MPPAVRSSARVEVSCLRRSPDARRGRVVEIDARDSSHGRVVDTSPQVGGVVPEQDHPPLYDSGVAAIFGPGTPLPAAADMVLDKVEDAVRKRRGMAVAA